MDLRRDDGSGATVPVLLMELRNDDVVRLGGMANGLGAVSEDVF